MNGTILLSLMCAAPASVSAQTAGLSAVELAPLSASVVPIVPVEESIGAAPLSESLLVSERTQTLMTSLRNDARPDSGQVSAQLGRYFEGSRALTAASEAGPGLPADSEIPTSGAALQDFIWTKRILPSAYKTLPESNGGWRNNLKALRSFITLGKTFDHDGDVLPASRKGFKLLHPFGSVAKIRYRARPGHRFTGLFAGADVPGLMRLSLGAPEKSGKFIPGAAIKLFVDGGPSANAVFLGEKTGVDGQQPDKNFFAQAFTNVLPDPRAFATKVAAFVLGLFNRGNALHIPVDHFAQRSADGTVEEEPIAPYRLLLKPGAGLGNASDTSKEFREELASLPVGSVIEVHASEGPGLPLVHIGDFTTTSEAVASEYGDKGLFFRHRRGRPAPTPR